MSREDPFGWPEHEREPTDTPPRPVGADTRETGRIEAFSDGVFAIAITLLILEVNRPDLTGDSRLFDVLWQMWPQFAAYLVSFITILIMWINHHMLFSLIRRIDRIFMMLNGLLLMMITFINYPMTIFADELQRLNEDAGTQAQAALAFYTGTFIIIAILYNGMWWYAAHRGNLLLPGVERQVALVDRQYIFGPLLYAIAFVLGFVGMAPLCIILGFGMDSALALYWSLASDFNPLAPLARRVLEREQRNKLPGERP